ncbi:MAG: SPJ_0845 family protein [Latilactobacillus curvatus]
MGLKVTNKTDLTGLFDKFASLPEERQKVEAQVEERQKVEAQVEERQKVEAQVEETADKLKKVDAEQKEKH